MAAAVVANCGTDCFRYAVQVSDQIFDRFALQFWSGLQCSVQVRNVSVVVTIVVNCHRRLVDMRFERVVRVRQCRQLMSHYITS
ncbi:hypothetical protein D3C84_952880 [compost metagenome]